jgi:hypothetical protein
MITNSDFFDCPDFSDFSEFFDCIDFCLIKLIFLISFLVLFDLKSTDLNQKNREKKSV